MDESSNQSGSGTDSIPLVKKIKQEYLDEAASMGVTEFAYVKTENESMSEDDDNFEIGETIITTQSDCTTEPVDSQSINTKAGTSNGNNRKEMENINIEKIVSEVQDREPLWNPGNASYKNVLVQKRLWNEVATNMRVDVNVLKRKWQNLRNQYAREKRKANLPTGSAATSAEKSTWRYFESLNFLAPSYASRPCVSNMPVAVEMLEESFQDESPCYNMEELENQQQPSPSNDPQQRRMTTANRIQQIQELIALEKEKIANIAAIKNNTSIDPFATSISEDLKKFSFIRQLKAKQEILEVLQRHAIEQTAEDSFMSGS